MGLFDHGGERSKDLITQIGKMVIPFRCSLGGCSDGMEELAECFGELARVDA